MSVRTLKQLSVTLSRFKSFENPSVKLEQYPTPAHIAAEWIWSMALEGEVAGTTALDAGSGPGILGLGLLLMGAKKVYFVEKDERAMKTCRENYKRLAEEYEVGGAEFIVEDISLFDEEVDIVVQNPPFGTKDEHIDKRFLEKAFSVAPVVYSMHKYSTKEFVESISKDNGFEITHFWRFEFPLKATFDFHTKRVQKIDVGLWRMQKELPES